MSTNTDWQHYETDSDKGRAMWNLRPEALAEEMLVMRPVTNLGVPTVHRMGCHYVNPPFGPGIPFHGALLAAIYRSERTAYLTGEPRHAAFCGKCMVTAAAKVAA